MFQCFLPFNCRHLKEHHKNQTALWRCLVIHTTSHLNYSNLWKLSFLPLIFLCVSLYFLALFQWPIQYHHLKCHLFQCFRSPIIVWEKINGNKNWTDHYPAIAAYILQICPMYIRTSNLDELKCALRTKHQDIHEPSQCSYIPMFLQSSNMFSLLKELQCLCWVIQWLDTTAKQL